MVGSSTIRATCSRKKLMVDKKPYGFGATQHAEGGLCEALRGTNRLLSRVLMAETLGPLTSHHELALLRVSSSHQGPAFVALHTGAFRGIPGNPSSACIREEGVRSSSTQAWARVRGNEVSDKINETYPRS